MDYKNKIQLEKLNYKDIPLLNLLSENEYEHIKKDIHISYYQKGYPIFRSNDPANKMYIILKGEMKISKIMSDGKEQILYIYEKGDFVGGHNILSGDKYIYNAYALKETAVITIASRAFNDVIRTNNKVLTAILDKSYERIRRAETLIDRLSVISTDVKVAKLLINLINLYGKKHKNGILVKFSITQEELGSLAGISRETMSRKLNQFDEEGYIEIVSRGKILIKNVQALENMLI